VIGSHPAAGRVARDDLVVLGLLWWLNEYINKGSVVVRRALAGYPLWRRQRPYGPACRCGTREAQRRPRGITLAKCDREAGPGLLIALRPVGGRLHTECRRASRTGAA
jgi:hypothetical protein